MDGLIVFVAICTSIGTIASGAAAVFSLFIHMRTTKLADDVNGITHQLISTSHQLGVVEGAAANEATQDVHNE